MKLIFSNGSGVIDNGDAAWWLPALPVFSFPCDGIYYNEFTGASVGHFGGGQAHLTDDQIAEVRAAILAAVKPAPKPPSILEIAGQLQAAVQDLLDVTAKSRGYDGMLSLCSYATSQHPPFAGEAAAGVAWRDAVWGYCYQALADVEAGKRAVPTVAALLAELPPIGWPA